MTIFHLNDLLEKIEIEPKAVLIMRHRPTDSDLRRVLPWFTTERPDLFNAYQSVQAGKNPEIALSRATFLASFIGNVPGQAHFVGLYRRTSEKTISQADYWSIPEYQELHRYGMSNAKMREELLQFELQLMPDLTAMRGKLILGWSGPERAWYRWADRNKFPIQAILEVSAFDEEMPSWDRIVLSWHQLQSLPVTWSLPLSQWRGIYLIFDESDGKSYVGSAYGGDNILGRWRNYAATGHGGNRHLRVRDPRTFQFSILQRVSPDMDGGDVIQLENTWKERLHTRHPVGLNDN